MSISCLDCGFVFQKEDHNDPCLKCGSRNRSITLTGEIKPHGSLKAGKKGTASRKHKHRFDQEVTSGKRIGKDGKLVSIEQVIDREQDTYKKTIRDEHGQIIVQKDEKLSKHR
jgi:CRISPR/Cas system-associated protein Cas5 (RAMP superfamily)